MLKLFKKHKARNQFDRWISDYHGPLFRHAVWLTGNQDIAADVVQETFFQAWRGMESLNESDKALPWLLTILRRCVYREQRHQYRHQETLDWLSRQELTDTGESDYQMFEIYTMLEQLSVAQREVFVLHHLHGFSYDDISEQLDIPIGTVMSRLSRARNILKQLHEKEYDDNVIPLEMTKRGRE